MDKYTEQRIKDTANIVDIVGDYVELTKRGREWEGLCPFHADRRLGSFKVNEAKNICTCFSCGKVYDSIGFVMAIANVDYPTALRMIAKRYGIATDGEVDVKPTKVARPRPKELPTLTIDKKWVSSTMGAVREDTLYQWLVSLPWTQEQRERIDKVAWLYALGHWSNRTLFWLIDAEGKVRSGKLMRYGNDGHRIKSDNPTWMHTQKEVHCDNKKSEFRSCLFGEHLLKRYPNASAYIVESEKTALICAITYGNLDKRLWLACGGLQHLKAKMLDTLINEQRKIYLWPDKDGEPQWREFANSLHYDKVAIYTQFLEKNWLPIDGPKADLADIIVRMLGNPKQTLAERMIAKNPALGKLIEELGTNIIDPQ